MKKCDKSRLLQRSAAAINGLLINEIGEVLEKRKGTEKPSYSIIDDALKRRTSCCKGRTISDLKQNANNVDQKKIKKAR